MPAPVSTAIPQDASQPVGRLFPPSVVKHGEVTVAYGGGRVKYDEVMRKAARSGLPAPEAPVILPDTRHDGKIDGVLCIAPARGTDRPPGYPGPPRARDGTRPVRDRVTRNDTGPRGVASRRTGSRQRREVRRRAVRCAGAGRGVGLRLSGANPRARRHADRSALGIVLPCDDNSGCSGTWYSSNSESADCQSTCRQAVQPMQQRRQPRHHGKIDGAFCTAPVRGAR